MIYVGLIGFGHVGKGTYQVMMQQQQLLSDRIGQPVQVKSVLVRDLKKYASFDFQGTTVTTDIDTLLNDSDLSIIVEVMGGEYPAYDYICAALKKGKFVVTANKEVMAKHKKTFFSLAKENGVDIFYEAAVAGGIPIIRSLKVGFAANKITSLKGIVNGTTNYILTKILKEKKDFDVILKQAQALGLAEADPTMDVSGLDAAYKLVLLAAVAFKVDISIEDVFYEGIESITLDDLLYANELGYSIKLLANGCVSDNDRYFFHVYPALVLYDHPLAHIHDETNAVFVYGDAVGEALLSGKGAGGSPTASAVVSDIIDIGFDHQQKPNRRNLEVDLRSVQTSSIDEASFSYFCRLNVQDQPGVLEKISGILSQSSVSISRMLQKNITAGQAMLILITHEVKESAFKQALTQLDAFDDVDVVHPFIRVA